MAPVTAIECSEAAVPAHVVIPGDEQRVLSPTIGAVHSLSIDIAGESRKVCSAAEKYRLHFALARTKRPINRQGLLSQANAPALAPADIQLEFSEA